LPPHRHGYLPLVARTAYPGAGEFLPAALDLGSLREAAAVCRGCDLYERATQTVFGGGPGTSRLMLVGEQPGDVEDTEGEPFVGPAGRLLDRALADAGLGDVPTYTTNAVKHFRWKEVRGSKRRIHDTPTAAQSTACRPWLAAELAAVHPAVLVALGATAAGSLFGTGFRLTQHRGADLGWPPARGDFATDDTPVQAAFATVHPSAVLRAPAGERDRSYGGFVEDLQVAARVLA
jgi:uracil-DNA glycosylase family protein